MSRKSIVHKDLKPDNILLNSEKELDIRIADFGFAGILSSSGNNKEEKIICGTPGYIAPEVLRNNGYSMKSDIFSAGSIFYALLSLKNLFYH